MIYFISKDSIFSTEGFTFSVLQIISTFTLTTLKITRSKTISTISMTIIAKIIKAVGSVGTFGNTLVFESYHRFRTCANTIYCIIIIDS